MRVEAVMVSVGYGDFLAETLPVNLQHFDNLVVVTSPDDRETQSICKKYSVECRPTGAMTRRGRKFAKALGIDHGLAFLAAEEWILHLDADIALPRDFRRLLAMRPMDPACIYGADRINVESYQRWSDYLDSKTYQHTLGYRVDPPRQGFPGSRLAIDSYGGYLPIGYFQLWHSSVNRRYPTTQRDGAEHTDVLHSIQWEPENRQLIPEFWVVHLNSVPAYTGANWRGRKTPAFGPGGLARADGSGSPSDARSY